MKAILVLAVCCLCSFCLHAQQSYGIKGTVRDTTSPVKLVKAAVSVLNAKDSTLLNFGWTRADGSFAVNNLNKGDFILLVTYPGYADYVDHFTLDPVNQVRDFGNIHILTRARLLSEVVISGKSDIIIKGDTTEFRKGSFVVQPNSKVEDLLKQLPGISVDKDGKITAQGVTVNKVLVDGEEFFSDDPTFVTRNIRGDMVEKLQLYDKKSDQAAFTGVDDGVKIKTINVVLKEDSKKGYFGKAEGGPGSNDFYQGQAMVNVFRPAKRISAYGTLANTGSTGLGYDEANRYSVGYSSDAVENSYGGVGIPVSRTSGIHYDMKWNKNKESLNIDYKIGSLNTDGSTASQDQQNLLSAIIRRNTDVTNTSRTWRQRVNGTFQTTLDSTSTLRFTFGGNIRHTETGLNERVLGANENEDDLYRNRRTLSDKGVQQGFNTGLLWNKRLKKTGRSLSFNITQSYSKNETEGFLNSANELYNTAGIIYDTVRVDQLKTNYNDSHSLNSNLNYNEPISKYATFSINYALNTTGSSTDRGSFNKAPTGRYSLRDNEFSNDFDYKQLSHNGGANFNYRKDKTAYSFGGTIRFINQQQMDNFNGSLFKRDFISLSPTARYAYSFSNSQSVSINYSGNTNQPSINQLQPAKTNNNPLYITVGNVNLKPSFSNSVNLNYSSYKTFSGRSISVYGYYNFTPGPITNSVITDATGKRISQAINVGGKSDDNYSFQGSLSRKLGKSGIQISTGLNTSGSRYHNLENSLLNIARSARYGMRFGLSGDKLDKYNFYLSVNPGITISKSSLQPLQNINRANVNSSGFFKIYLPGKMEYVADVTYQYTERTGPFTTSVNPLIINSSFSKKFMKSEGLKLSITGNDLLKRNTGFSASGFSQSSYTTIQRYFIGSLSYDFSRMGPLKQNPQ